MNAQEELELQIECIKAKITAGALPEFEIELHKQLTCCITLLYNMTNLDDGFSRLKVEH